jgi:hypothetical protein
VPSEGINSEGKKIKKIYKWGLRESNTRPSDVLKLQSDAIPT